MCYTTYGESAINFNVDIPGITELKDGLVICIKMHKTSGLPIRVRLNVNGLGQKTVKRYVPGSTLITLLSYGELIEGYCYTLKLVVGQGWIVLDHPKIDGYDLNGIVPVIHGGIGVVGWANGGGILSINQDGSSYSRVDNESFLLSLANYDLNSPMKKIIPVTNERNQGDWLEQKASRIKNTRYVTGIRDNSLYHFYKDYILQYKIYYLNFSFNYVSTKTDQSFNVIGMSYDSVTKTLVALNFTAMEQPGEVISQKIPWSNDNSTSSFKASFAKGLYLYDIVCHNNTCIISGYRTIDDSFVLRKAQGDSSYQEISTPKIIYSLSTNCQGTFVGRSSGGVSTSTDDGLTWTFIELEPSLNLLDIIYIPNKGFYGYALFNNNTELHVYSSVDGLNWTHCLVDSGLTIQIQYTGMSFNDNYLFIFTGSSSKLYRLPLAQSNIASNWEIKDLTEQFGNTMASFNSLFSDEDNRLYLFNGSVEKECFISEDNGDTWASNKNIDFFKDTAMGQSLENHFCKIQTGSYMGTGQYGSSYKNSLTFDFAPKVILFRAAGGNIIVKPLLYKTPLEVIIDGQCLTCMVQWKNNTITWSSATSADFQLNATNKNYSYIAFG